jgi:eukaryotic translation initiation factor 2-alpha kinase 4
MSRIFFIEASPYHLAELSLTLTIGLSLHSIGLSSRERLGQSKLVKLLKVSYYVKLLDLHRSNPFGPKSLPALDSTSLPESW